MSEMIYQEAVKELFSNTYGGLADRDRIKVVQLFDKLLAKGIQIHVDDLRRICRDAGNADYAADGIGRLYDDLVLIRNELENPQTLDYWPAETIDRIIDSHSPGKD